MAFNRRRFLLGLGGAFVALPFLEGLAPKTARAGVVVPSFALFYRRGNGVQQALFNRNANGEPEHWWPSLAYGALTQATLAADTSRAHSELSTYASRLGVVRGLKHPVGTELGHREGSIQGLTGAGVKYPGNVPDIFNCDPLGESLDNRIARELTPQSPTSLYLGVGAHDAGGVSFLNTTDAQGKNITRAADENMVVLYNRMFLPQLGGQDAMTLLAEQRKSVNDLVREELTALRSDVRLSKSDQDRLTLHFDAIRDVETNMICTVPQGLAADSTTYQNGYDNDNQWWKGNTVSQAGGIFAKMASLAIACGMTRSVLMSVGTPTDTINYVQVPGASGNDFHEISHRQSQDDNPATNIANAQLLHHQIDRFHLGLFRGILDALAAYSYSDGTTLLDKGVAVHYCDIGSGQHDFSQLPYLYVGGVDGALKTGLYVNEPNTPLVKFLNTIGAAVGCKNAANGPLDDFNALNNGGFGGRLASLIA